MRDMASKGPYFSKLLLNAIYFGSCKFSPREDVKGMHTQFRQRVRELLGGALDKSEITTIQAMLVMTNSLFALGDERSAAWIYAGIAFRMLIDLGAHLDSQTPKTTEEDLEIRRRVFWGAFGKSGQKQGAFKLNPSSCGQNSILVSRSASQYPGGRYPSSDFIPRSIRRA